MLHIVILKTLHIPTADLIYCDNMVCRQLGSDIFPDSLFSFLALAMVGQNINLTFLVM